MGELPKSGGGNLNVNDPRQVALGCYIPFPMPDGEEIVDVKVPRNELGHYEHLHIVSFTDNSANFLK